MRALVLGLLLLGAAPLAALPADATHCRPTTYPALNVANQFHVFADVEPPGPYGFRYDVHLWRETNGYAGLQRVTTPCIDGDIPPDTGILTL